MLFDTPEHRIRGDEGLDYIYQGEATLIEEGAACFVCHKPLDFPFIQWIGETIVNMHPECTLHLCLRLMRDVHVTETKYGLMTTTPDNRSRQASARQSSQEDKMVALPH
jgi:hypothetical protein